MGEKEAVSLYPLRCASCGDYLSAEPDDIILVCPRCQLGYEIQVYRKEKIGEPIEISFARRKIGSKGRLIFQPFWVFDTNIYGLEQDSFLSAAGDLARSFVDFLRKGIKDNDAILEQPGWAESKVRIFVPSFATLLDNIIDLGMQFLYQQPPLNLGRKGKMKKCIYGEEDAKKLAEFIFLNYEMKPIRGTKPILQYDLNYGYEIEILSSRLVGIPFYEYGVNMKDGILGIEI